MGVTPYINASIIMQLLNCGDSAAGEIELRKAKKAGRKLLRLRGMSTVVLGLIQGTAYYFYLAVTADIDGSLYTMDCIGWYSPQL